MKYILSIILFALSFAASAVTCSGSGTITGTVLKTGQPMLLVLDNGLSGVYMSNTTPNSGVVPQYLTIGSAPVQSVIYAGTASPITPAICDATQPGGFANVSPLTVAPTPPPVIPSVDIIAPVAVLPGAQRCGGPVAGTLPTTTSVSLLWAATRVITGNVVMDSVDALQISTTTAFAYQKNNTYLRATRLPCGKLSPPIITATTSTTKPDSFKPFLFGRETISLTITTTGALPQIVTYDADSMVDANGVPVYSGSTITPGTYTLSKTVDALFGSGGSINVSLQ